MTMSAVRVTVFGSSGFIGGALMRRLRDLGHDVIAPRRDQIGDAPPAGGYGVVVWAIGMTAGFRTRPVETVDAQVSAFASTLANGAFDRVIYLSSTRVYQRASSTHEGAELPVFPQEPGDLYNITKLAGEATCQACAPGRSIIVRLSNVVGPDEVSRDTFLGAICREARDDQIVLQTALDSAKDYIWIDDVVETLVRLATTGGRETCYNLARGVQTSHAEWTQLIAAKMGVPVDVQPSAPLVTFPPIDISRMSAEFHVRFANPLEYVDSLLSVGDAQPPND